MRECKVTLVANHESRVFAQPRFVIGADESADLVIDDPTLSRFHCEIRIVDGAAFVRDVGSRNGTRVDGVAVIEAPLRDGALLAIGRTELRFDLGTRDVSIPRSERSRFGRVVGESGAMRAMFAQLETAAPTNTTVLLEGENGTGKELIAEALHVESGRRGPFVIVDCGAIPGSLLEDELFGHERGAFTGATGDRIGAFEAAHGGTVFLDEIGELPIDLQPKLLRVLGRREIHRLGSTTRIPIDVRIIAATNRNLRAEVNSKRFRSDLYYRLAVLVITLPPLRDRLADLPLLVENILEELGALSTKLGEELRGPLLPELVHHAWPGNVRELRNYIEASLSRGEQVELVADDPLVVDTSRPLRELREQWVRSLERRYLAELLAKHGNNVTAVARVAGIDRVHLHRLLSRVGLR